MFPRRQRIPSAVLKKERGRAVVRSQYFILAVRPNQLDNPRFAVVVGVRAAKKAVARHALKRRAAAVLLREVKSAQDVILNILPPAAGLSAAGFRKELSAAVRSLN